jgi:hypothetical protein
MIIFTRAASKSPKGLLAEERILQLRALISETLGAIACIYATSLPKTRGAGGAAQNVVPEAEQVVQGLQAIARLCKDGRLSEATLSACVNLFEHITSQSLEVRGLPVDHGCRSLTTQVGLRWELLLGL